MLTPERLLRLMIEFIFIFLGALVIWLGLGQRFYVDRNGTSWLVLSVALILWGLRVMYRPGQWWLRWENWTRGLSLSLLGALMLAMKWVPFAYLGRMLTAGGAVLVLRGLLASFLMFRPH